MIKVDIFLCEPVEKPKKWKKWLGLCAIDENKKLYLLSYAIEMSEKKAFLCACCDGCSIVMAGIGKKKDHPLFDADWLYSMVKHNERKKAQFLKIKNRILSFDQPEKT